MNSRSGTARSAAFMPCACLSAQAGLTGSARAASAGGAKESSADDAQAMMAIRSIIVNSARVSAHSIQKALRCAMYRYPCLGRYCPSALLRINVRGIGIVGEPQFYLVNKLFWSILERFKHVRFGDIQRSFKVGNGAGKFHDAMVCARGEVQFFR